MGVVEDMLAVSSAKVLALYPSDEPVQVKSSPLNCEKKKQSKVMEEVIEKKKNKKRIVACYQPEKVNMKKEIPKYYINKFDVNTQKKRKRHASDAFTFKKKQNKGLDDFKVNKLKKEIKIEDIEYFEFENDSESSFSELYPDEKKVIFKIKKDNHEVTNPEIGIITELTGTNEGNHIIKKEKSFDIETMIKENAEKYNVKQDDNIIKIKDANHIHSPYTIEEIKKKTDVSKKPLEDNSGGAKKYIKRRGIHSSRKYSPGEDEVISRAIISLGDKINLTSLATELSRSYCSVQNRIIKLKTGSSLKQHRTFSLAEDLVILDHVLENLTGKSLTEFNLYDNGVAKKVASDFGRLSVSIINRWQYHLKLWLLQYYSGTLNLNIKRMLANYLEHFGSIEFIDWVLVAERPEFIGHTQGSLRNMFSLNLFSCAKRTLKVESTEITLKHIADYANEAYGEKNNRKISDNVLTRQKQVIDYFEQYVKKHGITNFL